MSPSENKENVSNNYEIMRHQRVPSMTKQPLPFPVTAYPHYVANMGAGGLYPRPIEERHSSTSSSALSPSNQDDDEENSSLSDASYLS